MGLGNLRDHRILSSVPIQNKFVILCTAKSAFAFDTLVLLVGVVNVVSFHGCAHCRLFDKI